MRADADLLRARLLRAVLLRRLPLWAATLLPLLWPARAYATLLPLLAWLAWVLLDAARWRQNVSQRWSSWLDAAVPALEDSSALLDAAPASAIAALQQKRLHARLLTALSADEYSAIARERARFQWWPPLLSVALLAATLVWRNHPAALALRSAQAAPSAKAVAEGVVYLSVTPPAYTGVAAFETAARDIQVPQFSEVRWCVRDAGSTATVELGDGQSLPVAAACAHARVTESLFWRTRGQAATRYNVRVLPDQAPQISILEPNELVHVLDRNAKTARLSITARDDYAVARASLHLTLARGSGENIRFSDREVPLPASADPRVRNWQKQWTLAELGMEPGDELYFFVRATDNAPDNPHTAQSPTYTLRLPGPASEDEDTTTLPSVASPESLRSQRQIIIDTEQLVADLKANPKMAAATLRSRSESIAADQIQLRLRYGQFLGEESSLFADEQEEEKGGVGVRAQSTEAALIDQYGDKHDTKDNATIFDPQTKAVLKRALAAMWDAEKSLRAMAPQPALPPEYKALDAIKELQRAERVYLHRTAFVPPALKEDKRMTGDIVGALSYKRAQGASGVAVPADVRDLVLALEGDSGLPALWSKTAREVISAHINDDQQKLAAQRAVQDVADGCVDCRAVLRAWLRGTLNEVPVLLQARPSTDTPFRQAWRGKEQP